MVTDFITLKDIEFSIKTNKCICSVCMSVGQHHNGKPIPSLEQLQQMENADKRAQDNRKRIQIINNTYAVCQQCSRQVLMLPEIESQATKRKAELERELVQLRERLHKHKTGLQKLQPKMVATTQNSINWRLTELKSSGQKKKKKVELKKRIPLYRKGEIWVCANCY
jgi:hypothetical protein